MTVSGGKLTVTGVVHDAFQVTSAPGGVINVSGGEFNVTDTTLGLVMSRNPATDTPPRASQTNQVARFLIPAAFSNIGKLTVGYDNTSSAGSATITLTSGELNLGAAASCVTPQPLRGHSDFEQRNARRDRAMERRGRKDSKDVPDTTIGSVVLHGAIAPSVRCSKSL